MSISKGARTRAELITVGYNLWREKGMEAVTATRTGSLVGVTHAACLYHFKSTALLRDAIAAHAVALRDPIIVPQLLAIKHPVTANMSQAEKMDHLKKL